jgi:hypothetical protein
VSKIEPRDGERDAVQVVTHCSGWTVSAHWDVPSTALSGICFAHLVSSAGDSHIVFVVRNDSSHSSLYSQTSDTTWQAYNRYGGNSLYTGSSGAAADRAVKVSYNRPFTTREYAPEDWVFNAEYPMVRWLERNGYAAASFRLHDEAGTAVPAVVTYDAATRTAILRPAAPLAGLVTYRATLKGGLAGVGDVAGNPLAHDRTWSFTTAVGPTGSPVAKRSPGGHGSGTKGAASGAHGSTSKAASALRVAVGPRSVRASGVGVVKLRVACPQSARSCRIKLRLRLGRRNLATKTVTVGGGHAKTVALKLSASARRDLRRRGSLAVTATAAVRDQAGHRATTATSIRLLAPRRR